VTQPLSFKEQAKVLEQVQELDLKIDQLKRNRDALPVALRTADQNLTRVKTSVEAKQKAIEEIEKVTRQTKAAMDLNNDRLARSSTRLEGVQNSQEFQAVQKEIEQLKKLNTSLEEQQKKSATDIEAAGKELEVLNGQLAKIQAERDEQSQAVSGQTGDLQGQIDSLSSERNKHAERIEKRILAQYDRIRMARSGIGFVPAIGGRCKGCNMVVPPQLYNEIQRGNHVHACPSCHRILFIPETTVGSAT
jgi:uncharacterized protein